MTLLKLQKTVSSYFETAWACFLYICHKEQSWLHYAAGLDSKTHCVSEREHAIYRRTYKLGLHRAFQMKLLHFRVS